MQVPPKLRRLINELWEQCDEYRLATDELLARQVGITEGPLDELATVQRANRVFGRLSDEQFYLIRFVDVSLVEAEAAIGEGFCRQVRLESPKELALRLAAAARTEWLESQLFPNYQPDTLWRPLLLAWTAGDRAAVEAFAARAAFPNPKPNNRAYAAICMAMVALHRRDHAALEAAVVEMRKRKSPAYVTGINEVTFGVCEDSPPLVADGLNRMVSRYRQYMFGDPDDLATYFDPFALGLFLMVREYNPSLVDDFDTTRKLPWNTEYLEWHDEQAESATVDFIDGLTLPDWLTEHWINLQPVCWAPNLLADR